MADNGPPVLIAALSGRALAAAARRAGYRPLVADLFNDMDTRRIAAASVRTGGDLASGFDAEALLAAVAALARGRGGNIPLVYGAGFEDRGDLLARLGARHSILGNSPEEVERIKHPRMFFPLLRRLGVPHPETRMTRPDRPRGWLEKRIGASGGGHIRAVSGRAAQRRDVYYQRRVPGRPISACFLADRRHARVIGFSAPVDDSRTQGYRFDGGAQPAALSVSWRQDIVDMIDALAGAFDLVGLNSADFVLGEGGPELLEINPRPGATLDIFDRIRPAYLFDAHCAACRGKLPRELPPLGAAACAVTYANARLTVGESVRWPRWAADIPPPGSEIGRNEPVCTVLARANSATRATALLADRSASIRQMLAGSGGRRRKSAISAEMRRAAP